MIALSSDPSISLAARLSTDVTFGHTSPEIIQPGKRKRFRSLPQTESIVINSNDSNKMARIDDKSTTWTDEEV